MAQSSRCSPRKFTCPPLLLPCFLIPQLPCSAVRSITALTTPFQSLLKPRPRTTRNQTVPNPVLKISLARTRTGKQRAQPSSFEASNGHGGLPPRLLPARARLPNSSRGSVPPLMRHGAGTPAWQPQPDELCRFPGHFLGYGGFSGKMNGSFLILAKRYSIAVSSCLSCPAISEAGSFSTRMSGSAPWFSTHHFPSRP